MHVLSRQVIVLLVLFAGCDYPVVEMKSVAQQKNFMEACTEGHNMDALFWYTAGNKVFAQCVDDKRHDKKLNKCPQFLGCTVP